MLTIGFANKFYTLWDVSEPFQVRTSTFNFHYEQTFTYIKNLSFDLQEAKNKLEGKAFQVDLSLRGHASYIIKYEILNDAPENVFAFGKYVGKVFSLDDINYLQWYYNETQNKIAGQLLADNGYIIHDEFAYSPDEFETVKHNIFIDSLKAGHHFQNGAKVELSLMEVNSFSFQSRYGYCYVVEYATSDGLLVKYIGGSPSDLIDCETYTRVICTVNHSEYNDENFTKINYIKKAR